MNRRDTDRDARRVMLTETLFVLAGSLVLSAVMHVVFVLLHRWTPAVLWGNLLTVAAVTLNFYLMCRSLQNAVDAGLTREQIKGKMRISQGVRLLFLAAVIGGGAYLSTVTDPPVFDLWALFVPLFFGRVTLLFRAALLRRGGEDAPAPSADAPDDAGPSDDPDDILPPFMKKGPAWEDDPLADGKEEHEKKEN